MTRDECLNFAGDLLAVVAAASNRGQKEVKVTVESGGSDLSPAWREINTRRLEEFVRQATLLWTTDASLDDITKNLIAIYGRIPKSTLGDIVQFVASSLALKDKREPAPEAGERHKAEAEAEEVGGAHYQQGRQVTPWELQRTMQTSGSVFADGRRCDAIKYVWRRKGDRAKMVEDLKKAAHCIQHAIADLSTP